MILCACFPWGRRPTFLLIILESVVVFTLSEEGDRFLFENLFGHDVFSLGNRRPGPGSPKDGQVVRPTMRPMSSRYLLLLLNNKTQYDFRMVTCFFQPRRC